MLIDQHTKLDAKCAAHRKKALKSFKRLGIFHKDFNINMNLLNFYERIFLPVCSAVVTTIYL